MKRAMTVTYEVGSGLYINLTNRCTNRCSFCIRNNGEGAYGSDSLWLEREPTVDEVLKSVESRDMTKYREVVFCGYGEPSYRLFDMVEIAQELKRRYGKSVRVNTNGHASLITGKEVAEAFSVFDSVSISLNAPNAEKYNEICHPVYKNSAFDAVVEFAENVKKYVQSVSFSVVREFLSEEELEACRAISLALDIPLRVRNYISS